MAWERGEAVRWYSGGQRERRGHSSFCRGLVVSSVTIWDVLEIRWTGDEGVLEAETNH